MSYGKGRFSNLDLPDPTLSYVANKPFKHHDLVFKPGDPVRVEQVGTAHLTKYIRARLVVLPVAPGEAVPPEAGAALLAERQPQDAEPEALPAELEPAAEVPAPVAEPEPVLIEKPAAVEPPKAPAPAKPAPKPAKLPPVTAEQVNAMSKPELVELSTARGLGLDGRLPLGAMRTRALAALKL